MFERSRELDPEFAPAYGFLGFSHLMDYINDWVGSADHSLEQALEISRFGVTLDPIYPWTRAALGNAYLWKRQHEKAIAEYETAIAMDPNFALGYVGLGWILHYAGRSGETIDLIHRGFELDPHS